ncbi:MAG: alpha/beta fold hydrolase [Parvibaculum sp.]|nr:alpha/beta fold hydrolase [Parvibaculum sp.]
MAFVKGFGILAAAVLLIMSMSFWAAGKARPALDAAARAALTAEGAAYDFIELPGGTVHYRLEGRVDAPLVVLVHGFSTPSFVWNDYIAPLTDAGYRVLAYDNFGRGLSDRPAAVYDADFFDRQLDELLDALGVNRRIDLVGYSMGGAIATIFAARHPERVRSLTLIAPAGLGVEGSGNVNLVLRPLIGDWIMRLFDARIAYNAAAVEAKSAPNPGAFLANFNRQLEYRGYGDALLSTLRHYPLGAAHEAFAAAGRSPRPVLVIWGEADDTVPFSHATQLIELMPQAQLRSYPGMGHNITFAQAPLVSRLLTDFLAVQGTRVTSGGAAGKPRGPLARMEARQCASCGPSDEGPSEPTLP